MVYFNRILMVVLVVSIFYLFSAPLVKKKKLKGSLQTNVSLPHTPQVILLPKEAIQDFGEGLLGFKSQTYKRKIEASFQYLGANTRPDQNQKEHFFKWNEKEFSLLEGELQNLEPLEGEELRSLSFSLEALDSTTFMKVFQDEKSVCSLSFQFPKVVLSEPYGDFKLDRNLLLKQKISWLGADLFLQLYGLEEFPDAASAQRIDFQNPQHPYSCFVQEHDLLVWKENRWQKADGESGLYPLLSVEKIENKLMHINIWNISGREKEHFLVSRTQPKSISKKLNTLKYVGAKTKKKWLVKNNNERFSLETGDWLIHQNLSWIKVNSIEALEAYIHEINVGELFIVKALTQVDGKKCLTGDLFNASRTEKNDYNLSLEVEPNQK